MMKDISEQIKRHFPAFSKGQKKIANAILYDYDKVAYMTAARFGQFVGVSESTVVRFAISLGYDGYSEFQRAVQDLVRTRLTPNQRIEITKQLTRGGDAIEKVMESDILKIRSSMEKLDREVFHKAVDALLAAKTVYIVGARSSELLARTLFYNLSLIFDNVKLVLPSSPAEVFEQMFSIGQEDLLFAFSFPRYSTKMIHAVHFAKKNGARVIVMTDSDRSPLAEEADFLLKARSDMMSYMDSLVAPISIINAIIVEITNRREALITQRFDRLEKIWDEYSVYTKK